MKCPKCGKEFPRLLALSREDNKTMICDGCGMREALVAVPDTVKERKVQAVMENKQEIVFRLKLLLKITRAGSGIEDLLLDESQREVTIVFEGGYKRKVNIEGDSGYAIIQDVMKAI